MKYQRIARESVTHLFSNGRSAFEVAIEIYSRHNPSENIWTDLISYMKHGFIVTRPHLFCMVKPCDYNGERCWFIQVVVGNLVEAISCLPYRLPKLIFTREDEPGFRVVDTQRLIELAENNDRKTQQVNAS